MKIPSLDMQAQLKPIRRQIDSAISRVLDSGNFILGKEVKDFEGLVCAYTGSKYAVGVSNGTDAIALALEAAGVKRGDRVICPAFTYYATAGAVARLGAVPVFADIDPKTYCIAPESIKQYFKRTTHNAQRTTKAIIPAHLYGQCADMAPILRLAKKHKLQVIEDAAQAFGAVYGNKKAGTMGDFGTASFFPGKNLGACGDAGMVITNNKRLSEKVRCLSNQGASFKDKYKHVLPGHNNRLDAMQAAILAVKLKYLDKWNRKRSANAAYYNKKLKDTGLITPYVSDANTHIYHQYMVRAGGKGLRDRIMKYLNKKGIDSRVFYPVPLHLQPCFAYLGCKRGDLPQSEKASQEVFSIPVYPELTKKQMDYVIDCVKQGAK